MNRWLCALIGLWFAGSAAQVSLGQAVMIYDATEIGGGQWQYTYEVRNLPVAAPIQEFTVWFDYGTCRNLQVAGGSILAGRWDQITLQPDNLLKDGGAYDARALGAGIAPGAAETGFAVRFDWLGVGDPGPQRFSIVDPTTFATIYSGMTVPEPTALLLFSLGAIRWLKRRCRHRFRA